MISCRRGGTTPSRLARRRRTIGHGRSSPRAEEVLGASKQPKNTTTKGGRAHYAGHLIEELDQPGATGKPPNTNRRGRATGAAQSSHLYQLSPEPNLPRQRLQEDDGAQHINAAQSEDLGFHPGDGSGGSRGLSNASMEEAGAQRRRRRWAGPASLGFPLVSSCHPDTQTAGAGGEERDGGEHTSDLTGEELRVTVASAATPPPARSRTTAGDTRSRACRGRRCLA